MQKALPKELVRVNLYLPKRREARFDFLRVETEASSDSEVTRQALRYLEQLVQDALADIKLKAIIGADTFWVTVGQFRDNPERPLELDRRSLILHKRSMERLVGIRAAMDAKDISEVVRCALRFYDYLVSMSLKGACFFAELPTGELLQIRLGIKVQIPSVQR